MFALWDWKSFSRILTLEGGKPELGHLILQMEIWGPGEFVICLKSDTAN